MSNRHALEAAHACAEHGVTACNACTPIESNRERMSEDVALVREACDDRDQCDAIDQSKGAFPRHYVAAFDRILTSPERKPLDGYDWRSLWLTVVAAVAVGTPQSDALYSLAAHIESLEADIARVKERRSE
jgi:hypothetical protein